MEILIVVLMSGVDVVWATCGDECVFITPTNARQGLQGGIKGELKRFNRKGYQYVLSEDEQGNEVITRYAAACGDSRDA